MQIASELNVLISSDLLNFPKNNVHQTFPGLSLQGNALDGQDEETGNTALHFAIQNENVQLIFQLTMADANWEVPNKQGKCPMDLGFNHPHLSIRLLSRLWLFDARLKKETAEQLDNSDIQRKNSAEKKQELEEEGDKSAQGLFKYIIDRIYLLANEGERKGCVEALQQTIESYPHAACYHEYRDALEDYLATAEDQAHSFLSSGLEHQPIFSACLKLDRFSVVKLLNEKYSSMSTQARNLIIAVNDGEFETVKKYLDEGADPDQFVDRYISTILLLAIAKHHIEIAKLLMDRGASVSKIPEKTCSSAIDAAKSLFQVELVLYFWKFQAQKNIDNTNMSREFFNIQWIKLFELTIKRENSIRSKLCQIRLERNNSLTEAETRELKRADELSERALGIFELLIASMRSNEFMRSNIYLYLPPRKSFFNVCLECQYVKHYDVFFSRIKLQYQQDLQGKDPNDFREPEYEDNFLKFFLKQTDKGPYASMLSALLVKARTKVEIDARFEACRSLLKSKNELQPGFNLNSRITVTENPNLKSDETRQAETHPLLRAVFLNDIRLAQLFIEHGAVLNYPSDHMLNPLSVAVATSNVESLEGQLEMVGFLLKQKVTITNQHVIAAERNNYEMVELLLKAGADVNRCLSESDKNTCLSLAVKNSNLRLLQLLLKFKASVNYTNESNLFHDIAQYWKGHPLTADQIEIIQLLARHGVNPNVLSHAGRGRSPLAECIFYDNIFVFTELLKLENTDLLARGFSNSTVLTLLNYRNQSSTRDMAQQLLSKEWLQFFKQKNYFEHEKERIIIFIQCFSKNLSNLLCKNLISFKYVDKKKAHEVSTEQLSMFEGCSDFEHVNKFYKNFSRKQNFASQVSFPESLFALYKKMKKREISEKTILEALWQEVPEKQIYDRKKRFKENAELQRQAEPVISALLRMPRRFDDIQYFATWKKVEEAKNTLEKLIQDNNKTNRQQPAKQSKINTWKERLKNNPARMTWLTEQFSSACGLIEQIERQFKRFNENYERIRNQVLELINDGQIDPAKRLLQVLENFLNQESDDPKKMGVIVLNKNLNDILNEINISIQAYEKHNKDDGKLERTQTEASKEENLVESKNREEASRLAQDRKVKAESFLNKREQFLKETQKLRQAWENASTQVKPKATSDSPEQGSTTLRVKKKQFPSPSLGFDAGRRPDEEVNGPGLGLVEFKRKVEEDTVSTQDYRHSQLRRPPARTLANITELPKQLELREELAQLQQILENQPTPNDLDARKFQCYALLLTCAQTMHTIKSIKGEPLFPQPMAEQFRNAIYHCYTLFGGFAGKEALILEPKKTKTQTASTVTVPAKEVFDQVQDMALKLFQYMKGKLNKTETSPSTGTETERKVQQESDNTPAGEKLKTQTKSIMQAIDSPLFNAILRLEIPAKQPSCVAIMFDAYQELQTLKNMDKKSVFWLIRKQASDLLTARVGSLFAYASDHCSELLEGLRNKRQYRQLRAQGNEIRHNDHTPAQSAQFAATVVQQSTSGLSLGGTALEAFPALSATQNSPVLPPAVENTLSVGPRNRRGELVLFSLSLNHSGYQSYSASQVPSVFTREYTDYQDEKDAPKKTNKND